MHLDLAVVVVESALHAGLDNMGGGNGGWVFVALVFCVAFVYCFGGVMYRYAYTSKRWFR